MNLGRDKHPVRNRPLGTARRLRQWRPVEAVRPGSAVPVSHGRPGAWRMLALSEAYWRYVVQRCVWLSGLVWMQNRRPKT